MSSRPGKLNNVETISYEIEMLEYSFQTYIRIRRNPQVQKRCTEFALLESFLLHFRNLIEFFNGNPRFDNDLNVARPTQLLQGFPQAKPEESQISSLEQPRLFEKYEGRDVNDKISRYLHHCTTQRVELKDWNLGEMYGEIEPLLTSFKELFPQVESVAHCETPRLVVGTSDGSSTQS